MCDDKLQDVTINSIIETLDSLNSLQKGDCDHFEGIIQLLKSLRYLSNFLKEKDKLNNNDKILLGIIEKKIMILWNIIIGK